MRVELDGKVLAESDRPTLVFETNLPVRYYLPREDVRVDLRPSDTRTICAYKGVASYWSVGDQPGPGVGLRGAALEEARELAGLVAFYDDRVQVTVDAGDTAVTDTEVAAALADERSVTTRG